MDRIIEVKINGNYLTKDNDLAGVQGEANATHLRITFDESWDGYGKQVLWQDAKGENPVTVIPAHEDEVKSMRVYLCPIPGEALVEAGRCTFVIEGVLNNVVQRSFADTLKVKPAPVVENPGNAVDPTPSDVAQIQANMEAILQKSGSRVYVGSGEMPEGFSVQVDPDGEASVGFVPAGGATGQVLAKTSGEDYDVQWVDGGSGGGSAAISARIGSVSLPASAWVTKSSNLYAQVVKISGVTEYSQVDLTPSVEQLAAFYDKDLAFVTENEDGVVTVYAIGQKPTNNYTIQVTITEVSV